MEEKSGHKRQFAVGIGHGLALVRSSYNRYIERKAAEAHNAVLARLVMVRKKKYILLCHEISEIFNELAKVVPCIKETDPMEVSLPHDFTRDILADQIRFRIPKVFNEIGENVSIRIIQATINAIVKDRFRLGLAPFLNSYAIDVADNGSNLIANMADFVKDMPDALPLRCGLGAYVGVLCVDTDGTPYISSKDKIPLGLGEIFQTIFGGRYVDALIKWACIGSTGWGLYLYIPHVKRYFSRKEFDGIISRYRPKTSECLRLNIGGF